MDRQNRLPLACLDDRQQPAPGGDVPEPHPPPSAGPACCGEKADPDVQVATDRQLPRQVGVECRACVPGDARPGGGVCSDDASGRPVGEPSFATSAESTTS